MSSIFRRFNVTSTFWIVDNIDIITVVGGMTISAARPKVTSPSNSLTTIWWGRPLKIYCLSLSVQKLLDNFVLLDFPSLTPIRTVGMKKIPLNNFFLYIRPLKKEANPCTNIIICVVEPSVERFNLWTWRRRKLTKSKKRIFHVAYAPSDPLANLKLLEILPT